MGRERFHSAVILLILFASLMLAPGSAFAQSEPTSEPDSVSGTVIHRLESPPDVAGNPSLASITDTGMSCSVSFGNNMGGDGNFSMVVYSEEVEDTVTIGRMAVQWGTARSITLQDGDILESALYDYIVLVKDESEQDGVDTWSMTLWGDGQMFDGVTFSGPVLVGDLQVQP